MAPSAKRARTDDSDDDCSEEPLPRIEQVDWRAVVCQFLGMSDQQNNDAITKALKKTKRDLAVAGRSPRASEEEIDFIEIHRITCSEQETTELSIGEPWPVKNADGQIHLRGSELIEHLELYLERHKSIIFIAYKDHECCQSSYTEKMPQQTGPAIPKDVPRLIVAESVNFVSPGLGAAFRELWSLACEQVPPPVFDGSKELCAPYLWWYWHREQLQKAMRDLKPPQISYIQAFERYLDSPGGFGEEYQMVDKLLKATQICPRYLPYLYKKGDIQLSKQGATDIQFWKAFKASSELRDLTSNGTMTIAEARVQYALGCRLCIKGTHWSYDGCFQKEDSEWAITCDFPWEEPFHIESLDVYPLKFAPEGIKESLRQRGEMFWRCRSLQYISYRSDSESRSQRPSDERYMIDIKTFNQMHPQEQRRPNRDDIGLKAMQQCERIPLGDDFVFCLPSTIPGFHMKTKKWMPLHVHRISPVEWNTDAFKLLVVGDDKKTLIRALVTNQIAADESTDFMSGKGNGLIILLHGPPGTGKTLTAESVAEIAQKPLYRVTCGDVGTKPEDVEKYLETVMLLGKTWGCIVLLDEADVFLVQRSTEDFERNALVSVFLRVLEYYEGILILTSNRVGTLDAAFKSRIQLSLEFPRLKKDERLKIWTNFINHVENISRSRPSSNGLLSTEIKKKLPEMAENDLNGREIRNAVSTARQLAMFEGQKLGYRHLEIVVSEMKRFNAYAKMLNSNLSDDEIARQNREY